MLIYFLNHGNPSVTLYLPMMHRQTDQQTKVKHNMLMAMAKIFLHIMADGQEVRGAKKLKFSQFILKLI